MKKLLPVLMMLLFMAGCSSGRPSPDWLLKGFNRLEDFKSHYLEGRDRLAELNFQNALEEINKSGDLEVLARTYLIRMAMDVAVLERPRDDQFLKMDAVEPHPVHQSFHAFLTGQLDRTQIALLSEQYRGILKRLSQGDTNELAGELKKIEDPVSRLIASGVCIGQGRLGEDLLRIAVETASQQGWKKAVLVYLEKLRVYYDQNGQRDQAAAIKQKLLLISF